MHAGDIFHCRTHYELLNTVFHTSMRGYMKTVWNVPYDCNSMVWMIRVSGAILGGWKNTFENGGSRIREQYFGGGTMPHLSNRNRLVFAIDGEGHDRTYTFLGVYKYLTDESNPHSFRIYERIADEYLPR